MVKARAVDECFLDVLILKEATQIEFGPELICNDPIFLEMMELFL